MSRHGNIGNIGTKAGVHMHTIVENVVLDILEHHLAHLCDIELVSETIQARYINDRV